MTTQKDRAPNLIVPSSDFASRTLRIEQAHELFDRTRTKREKVNLIRPILLNENRKWGFSFHEGAFGAQIKDQDFLDRVLSGQEPIPMISGITMDVLLETREEFVAGVWEVKERKILKVLKVNPPLKQQSLGLPEENEHSPTS